MIIAVWIRAVASGWRAMPSVARAADLADADAGADHGQSGGETRADEAVALVRAGRGGRLQQGEDVQHVRAPLREAGDRVVGRARRAWIASPGATSPR